MDPRKAHFCQIPHCHRFVESKLQASRRARDCCTALIGVGPLKLEGGSWGSTNVESSARCPTATQYRLDSILSAPSNGFVLRKNWVEKEQWANAGNKLCSYSEERLAHLDYINQDSSLLCGCCTPLRWEGAAWSLQEAVLEVMSQAVE